jgi:hypothetical protein
MLLRGFEPLPPPTKTKPTKPTTSGARAYANYHRERQLEGRWVPLFVNDLRQLTLEQCALISTIVNLGRARADAAGWMLLTQQYLTDGPLALTPARQSALLGALVAKGLLEMRGDGGRRQVRLMLNRLRQLVRC